MNPSPRVSVCRSGRQHSGQGSCRPLARKDLCSQVGSRPEPPAADAKGDQRGVGQHSGVWSSTLVCGARLSQQWSGACLSYALEVVYATHLGLFDVLAPLMASGNLPRSLSMGGPTLQTGLFWSPCVGILGVSPCQMCLL